MAFTSNTLQNYEQLSYGGPGLSMHRAKATQVIALAAARTLLPREAGATVLWDAAAGFTITLPVPVAGMELELIVTTSVTSSNHKVITDAATTFILGEVLTFTTATASPAGFAFDGSTHVACTMNGTTSGGLIGTALKFKALSATVWFVSGLVLGSGTIITPAATS